MKKGKHSKNKQEKIKERAKKDIKNRLIILIICLVSIVLIIQTQNEKEEVSTQESTNSEEVKKQKEENKKVSIEVTEPTEDENIKNLITELKTKNNLTENNFAFFYYNPQTQKYYFDNQEKYFKGASTIKVPVAMLYYDKIKSGELTEDKQLQYTSDDYEAGGGTTSATYKVGSYIPISFLLEQSIINSDNTAVNILIDGIGYRNCREQIAKYSDEQFIDEFFTTNLITAALGYDIINHIYQNQKDYQQLIEYMKQSSNGEYLKKYVTEYDVAHKYGSYEGNVHDYGIVYAESPYLIGVFTNGVAQADELIADISRQVLDKIEEK